MIGGRGRRTRRARRKACLVLIGNRIRTLREAANLSRAHLARRWRLYTLELKDLEDGLEDCYYLTLDRIAEELGLSLPELLDFGA